MLQFITSAGLGRDDQYWLRNISTRIGRNVVDMDVGKDVRNLSTQG